MNTAQARENRAYVQRLLREKQPQLAVVLNAAADLPCRAGCQAVRESQYIEPFLNTTEDPATRYTPWTYLKYTLRGSAWASWSWGYHDALMRAVSRRLAAGVVTEVRSKGGSTTFVRAEVTSQIRRQA